MILNKILLVDDDPEDQDIFISVIKEILPTIKCFTADCGTEAIDFLMQTVPLPSLILMDINMPVMNGLECLAEIKKIDELKTIPVVMLTTASDYSFQKKSLDAGAKLFLTKASTLNEIKSQLRMVLEKTFVTGFSKT